MIAKVADPAAHIRYASMYGTGLVELHKYKEAIGPLDEAIQVANKTRGVAYPTIAVTAKIEALGGLGENREALALAAEEMRRVSSYQLAGPPLRGLPDESRRLRANGTMGSSCVRFHAVRPDLQSSSQIGEV